MKCFEYLNGSLAMDSRMLLMIVVMVASLSTVSATDIFLPSLPSMATYFSASVDATQLVIPMYLMGGLIAAPLLGTLSDVYGRQKILLIGMTLFLLGTMACIYAPSLSFLISARFLQGFGAISSSVVGWALIQDLYPSDEGAKFLSWAGSVTCIAPLMAPALGGYVQVAFGWQGNFFVILICAILAIMLLVFAGSGKGPLPKTKKMSPLITLRCYGKIITDKPFLFYISFFSVLSCGEWCYLTLIPFYFENTLHLSPNVFGLYLSLSALFYMLGTLTTPLILSRLGTNQTLALAIKITFLAALFFLCVSLFLPTSPLFISLSIGLYFFGSGIIWGPSVSRALQRFETDRGAASAVRSFLNMAAFAAGGFIGSFLDDSSLLILALVLTFTAIICGVIFMKLMKLEPDLA